MIKRIFLWPVITLAVLAIHHQAILVGFIPNTAAGLFLLVVAAAYFGGLRAAIISAGILSGYSLIYLGPITTERVMVAVSYLATAALVGWQTRQRRWQTSRAETNQTKADGFDALNGNIEKLRAALIMVIDVQKKLPDNHPAQTSLALLGHLLTNLIQATAGWRQLDKIRARNIDE